MTQRRNIPDSAPPATVVIADDHELARAGLRSMLEGEPWITVVGEGGNGREAVALCELLRPDLALIDVRMPELDGIAATGEIKRVSPDTRVLIITTHMSPEYLLAALETGATSYLLKDITRQELHSVLQRALRGESVMRGEVAAKMLRQLSESKSAPTPPLGERLTPREREVLTEIVGGLTNREIAARLSVSVGTVKVHVERIIGKLGVTDRTQAAVWAVEHGFLKERRRNDSAPE